MRNWLRIHESNLIRFGAVATTLYFVAITAWVSQSLTFFWDDYEVIGLIAENPVEQLFANGVGHFGPLWRVFFLAEVYIFGPHFPLYTVTSALLAAIGFWGFAWSLRPVLNRHFWIIVPASVLYFTSLGVMAQIVVAVGSEFTLAFAFAGLAAYTFSRSRKFAWPVFFLTLSALSLNGTLPINYSMFSAVVVTYYVFGLLSMTKTKLLLISVGGITLSILWVGVSAVLGSLNPSPYYADTAPSISSTAGTSPSLERLLEFTLTTYTLITSWIGGPVVPGALVVPDTMSRLTFLIAQYLVVFVLLVIFMLLLFAFLVRGNPSLRTRSAMLVAAAWGLPVVFWAALVVYTRPESLITARYANIWLPPVLFFIIMTGFLLVATKYIRIRRLVVYVISSLLAFNVLIGLALAPQTALSAANIERPRTALSGSQQELMQQCLSGEVVIPIDEISPLLQANDFCVISRFLLQETLLSKD